MHFKRKRTKIRRLGNPVAKPCKVNGFNRRGRADGESFSAIKRRVFAMLESKQYLIP